MAGISEIREEYTSSLQDLTFNSKPLISVLTILAEENVPHAKEIVEAIESHLSRVRVEVKLPVLYLIDCIIKNVDGPYTALFCQNIVSTFCNVFKQVDEQTRAEMFRLRQTWNDVIPPKKLYALDVQIAQLDPAWPVTAPPPSIHFNPKFLKTTTTTASGTLTAPISSKLNKNSMTNTSSLDTKTLSMQQKLINKQKELLELQQRKLQLELLQTQVKLQEQQLIQNTSTVKTTPQVNGPHTQQSNAKSSSGGSKISPANSNPANARPIRDPRLLRQQQQQQQAQQALSNVNANVHLESKSKFGSQHTLDSENKFVNSKTSVRNDHVEHRLVNNKGNIDSHGKSKTSPHSSPLKHTQKIGSSLRKNSKFSRDSKTPNISDTSSDKITIADPSSKAGRGQPSKPRTFGRSFLKIKKKSAEKDSPDKVAGTVSPSNTTGSFRNDKDSSALNRADKKSDKQLPKSCKSDKEKFKSDGSFKDPKGSVKNRNYMRRNRNASASPEPTQDLDLRIRAPPEKQPRLQGENNIDDKTGNDSPKQPVDVDLRQLPSVISKKRPSTENQETSNAKKSRTEMFDVLFGSEDTDLRQLPPVLSPPMPSERPPTPPAPIISDKLEQIVDESRKDDKGESNAPKNSNLDALRAKLANAVNQTKLKESESLPKEKLQDAKKGRAKSFGSDKMDKIIISSADEESIKAGNMTKAQKNALMHKILAQIETHKLREAQRKECESVSNPSLQPISDEEPNFSGSESDEEVKKRIGKSDRDDRTSPIPSQVSQLEGTYPPYSRQADQRDPRRTRAWRGRHRKVWDYPPTVPRPTVRPSYRDNWVRPMNDAWRPQPLYSNNFGEHVSPFSREHGTQSPNSNSQELPTLEYAHPDSYKFITIDNEPREIRYYDETAIVFMNSSDPREISFHNGTRRIFFDGEPFLLKLNSPYEEISLKGNVHRVRLGAPSREIFIDGKGYECYFDKNEKVIDLDGNKIFVKLEAPPPQVKIGQEKRLDLVAGKVQLVVDARNMYTIFLDAKLQTFVLENVTHTLKFVDSLRAALINDVRFEIEYGGLPKPIMLHDKKHFIRFSVLPEGIKPGNVNIKDMEVTQPVENEALSESVSTLPYENTSQDSLPEKPKEFDGTSPEHNSNSPHNFHHPNFNNLDMLSSVIASSMLPSSAESGYQVEDTNSQDVQSTITIPRDTPQVKNPPSLNINDLFQRLVATGIVTTAATAPPQPVEEPPPPSPPKPSRSTAHHVSKHFKPPTFSKPETLKTRRPPLIHMLYTGMQCSSCGMRFPADQTMYYSQHLDWHFRQNRRGKKNIRKAASRRWHYTMLDWRNYEEIEDLEEREKNYFENQQNPDGTNDDADEEIEIPCVPADPNVPNAACEVCRDKFEQFYNEEKDEWQLRMAIRVEDKTYHPLCYEDYQASLVDPSLEESKLNVEEQDVDPSIPGLGAEQSANETYDDVMEVIDNIDEEEAPPPVVEEPKVPNISIDDDEEEVDDDVILNEVAPERIVVDDDDKDDYVSGGGLIPGVVVKVEPVDDGFVDVEGGLVRTKEVKLKAEDAVPATDDVETVAPAVQIAPDSVDTTHTEVVSTIDGNVEFESGVNPSTGISGKIKINITKPIPAIVAKETKETVEEQLQTADCIDPSQPLPPGEEPVQLNIKPALQGLELKRQPTVKKGSELTGLCSIM
ncbi:hypothetical protein PPYR_10577 [Photinus pyralis]|uniref:CID domain-containing protein n=2 Tax=Photinus pyralis TaxID=7054 RepID=A0A1Y1LSH8_PHOPY|nr:uncharacterized protein LOC116174410 isoform X2 [Photinus pyralis]KAB0796516.1 hypothetical protein PPYR_10577 [Photinus pyralis]